MVDLTALDPDLSKPNVGVIGDDSRTNASKEFGFKILDKFEQIIGKFLHETFPGML